MIVACVLYLSHLSYFLPLIEIYHFLDPFYHLCSLLVYPMYFVYIRLLTVDEEFSFKRHSKYFILPFVLFVFYVSGIFVMSEQEHITFLYKLLPSKQELFGIFAYQKTIYFICRASFVLQGVLYLFLANRLITRNKQRIQDFYANTESRNIDKIYILNISIIISMIVGVVLSTLGKEAFLHHDHKLILPSILMTSMLFIVGWLGYRQQAVVIQIEDEQPEVIEEEVEEGAVSPHLEQMKQSLQTQFEVEKVYLNKDLTLWDLCRTIGTNRTYISMIINKEFNQSFSSFVNKYRVSHAKHLLLKDRLLNSQDLADMSGFGSVASMQRAFSQFEGKTLSQMRDELS